MKLQLIKAMFSSSTNQHNSPVFSMTWWSISQLSVNLSVMMWCILYLVSRHICIKHIQGKSHTERRECRVKSLSVCQLLTLPRWNDSNKMSRMQWDFCCDFNTSTPDLLMGQALQNNVIYNNIAAARHYSSLYSLHSAVLYIQTVSSWLPRAILPLIISS